MKYEGEYLNGLKNGKGIEYTRNPNIKYICEYKNGKKHGKGKEYSYNYESTMFNYSHLLFEGEYVNDYRLKGKEYYINGKLKFEGEYLFDQKLTGKLYD